MSLPKFPTNEKQFTREEVINMILASIAMEELGLSHIINAEGEKLQYAMGTIPNVAGPNEPATINDLLALNESIRKTLDVTAQNQLYLKAKMQSALESSVVPGPTGPAGPPSPFLSGYIEASANGQTVAANANIVFDAESVDTVGDNIKFNAAESTFVINRTGLYHIEWNVNLKPDADGNASAVIGIAKNGKCARGAACTAAGGFSSGTYANVKKVPFLIALCNINGEFTIENPIRWKSSAASIRILRFADGQGE